MTQEPRRLLHLYSGKRLPYVTLCAVLCLRLSSSTGGGVGVSKVLIDSGISRACRVLISLWFDSRRALNAPRSLTRSVRLHFYAVVLGRRRRVCRPKAARRGCHFNLNSPHPDLRMWFFSRGGPSRVTSTVSFCQKASRHGGIWRGNASE